MRKCQQKHVVAVVVVVAGSPLYANDDGVAAFSSLWCCSSSRSLPSSASESCCCCSGFSNDNDVDSDCFHACYCYLGAASKKRMKTARLTHSWCCLCCCCCCLLWFRQPIQPQGRMSIPSNYRRTILNCFRQVAAVHDVLQETKRKLKLKPMQQKQRQ